MSESKLRLRELDLEEVAHGAVIHLTVDVTRKLVMLYKTVAPLAVNDRDSALYHAVIGLGTYARTGVLPRRRTYTELMAPVLELYRSWFFAEVDALEVEPAEPNSPLGVIVLAAAARDRLDRGEPLGCAELAALVGVDRDYIVRLAPEIPSAYRDEAGRKSWSFKPTSSLKQWIEERLTKETRP